MRLVLDEGHSANDILEVLLPQARIRAFKELLPSMNDIFISVVKKGGVDE